MALVDRKSKLVRTIKRARVAETTTGHNGVKVNKGFNGQFCHNDANDEKSWIVQDVPKG